jgi:hypothetical protein
VRRMGLDLGEGNNGVPGRRRAIFGRSLDDLDQFFESLHLPSPNVRARISVCLRSGTVRDLKAILATISREAQCIDIEFSFLRPSVET